ncbi:MAG: FAD-binding oxidoreductase [Longimicrobiales bacterium]
MTQEQQQRQQLVTAEYIRGETGARAEQGKGECAIHGVVPAVVVEPSNGEQAAAVLALCSAEGWKVETIGGGTWLGHGAAPDAAFVLISTRRLAGLEDYQPEDLTATAGAGTTLDVLQAGLMERRQWVALDPPSLPGSTIGATVASASAGPLRARFGTPRDHVIGLDIATGDGRLLHFGGHVVKNVAGYDIVRPIIGSFGTLGLITRVSLRLRAIPDADETLAITVPRGDAPELAAAIAAAWPAVAIELLSPWLATEVIGESAARPEWTLLVRLQGHPAENVEGRTRINRLAPAVAVDTGVWARLGSLEAAAEQYVRLAAKITRMAETLNIANTLSDHILTGPSRVAVHACDGIVRLWGAPSAVHSAAPVTEAAQNIATIDGTVIYRNAAQRNAENGRRARIEAGVRAAFDPAGILAGYRL